MIRTFKLMVFFLVVVCADGLAMSQDKIELAEDFLGERLVTHDLLVIPELDRELELTTEQAEQCCEKLELLCFGSNSTEEREDHDAEDQLNIEMAFFDEIFLPHQIERSRQLRLQAGYGVTYKPTFGLLKLKRPLALTDEQIQKIVGESQAVVKEVGMSTQRIFKDVGKALKSAAKRQLANLQPHQRSQYDQAFGTPYVTPSNLQVLLQMTNLATEVELQRLKRLGETHSPIDLKSLSLRNQDRNYSSMFILFGLCEELELTEEQIAETKELVNRCVKNNEPIGKKTLEDVLLSHQLERLNQIVNQTAAGFSSTEFSFGLLSLKESLRLTEKQIEKIDG